MYRPRAIDDNSLPTGGKRIVKRDSAWNQKHLEEVLATKLKLNQRLVTSCLNLDTDQDAALSTADLKKVGGCAGRLVGWCGCVWVWVGLVGCFFAPTCTCLGARTYGTWAVGLWAFAVSMVARLSSEQPLKRPDASGCA